MAPPIEFSFQLTEEDIGAAAKAFPFRWNGCVFPGIATSLVGVGGSIAVIFLEPDWLGIESPQWLGIGFAVTALDLMLICCGTLMPRLRRWAGIRQFRLSPAAQGKMTYQVFDDHIKSGWTRALHGTYDARAGSGSSPAKL